jgi:hypothetical protein
VEGVVKYNMRHPVWRNIGVYITLLGNIHGVIKVWDVAGKKREPP